MDTEPERRNTAIPSTIRHGLTVAWRNIIKIRYNPEQLMDVTFQPIVFILLFVFVFGGAVSHDWHKYLTFVLPGIMVQTVVFGTISTGVNLNTDPKQAVIVRKPGKWFAPEEAADYIGGYVIFNDITARDIQRREMRSGVFSFCKAIDTFCPLGPWIVTPDEIADPHNLKMELRVNGEPRQVSHTSRMSVTIPEIISHYSPMGYGAGDIISTGTVSGVAGFR